MNLFFKPLAAGVMLAAFSLAHGAGVPEASPNDPRIRVIPYKANDVTVIRVQRGTVTRIMLERDEKIEITISSVTPIQTRLDIRVGAFGDKPVSQRILSEIVQELRD